MADRIGGLLVEFYRHILDLKGVASIFQGDDMGFKTGTLIAPDALRAYCLPWQKRFASMAHESGRPYFLHSCGNLLAVMEDLIEEVKIDGKHSFENAIIPVQEFQKRFGDRIAILGGLDINLLTRCTPAEVRREIGTLMDVCGARGRYAVGSGNSVPSYIPVQELSGHGGRGGVAPGSCVTPKQRVHAALRRRPADRAPVFLWLHPQTAQRLAALLEVPAARSARPWATMCA